MGPEGIWLKREPSFPQVVSDPVPVCDDPSFCLITGIPFWVHLKQSAISFSIIYFASLNYFVTGIRHIVFVKVHSF